tara:strand:+ start:192 stop:449 length:258 start_codon:yes stop_codon:yes gene_type:complete
MKIQKMISLDRETADIASRISNFSNWVRNQLRSHRNQSENDDSLKANTARAVEDLTDISTARLLWHLERRTDEEIRALINLLRGV